MIRSKEITRLGAGTAARVAAERAKQPLRARPRDWLWPLSLPFLGFLILPLAALLARAPAGQLLEYLRQPEVYQAIELSLNAASLATLASILIGTPVAYLIRLRLHRVRQGLMAGTHGSTTVTAEAVNWGFWHFGEFSHAYKECFGESPSDTLRRPPSPHS